MEIGLNMFSTYFKAMADTGRKFELQEVKEDIKDMI